MMNENDRVVIQKLKSGVPGLDEVLGGGIPEYSFNLIAGSPGTGKTTLAQQIMFANATPERPALFLTVLGEPPIKMLRYQQQFRFFDPARVGTHVRFINLSNEVLEDNLDNVLERITREVEEARPGMVAVDSFRSVIRATRAKGGDLDLQHFVHRLALRLTSWETTSFLIGEFADGEAREPVFTVADSIIWLLNEVDRNAAVRKLRVSKVRGQPAMPGLHTMRISDEGVEIYPRGAYKMRERRQRDGARMQIGVAGLDELMGGGIPAGDSVLVTGPTGSGKTIMATQFIATGIAAGETAVAAVFEEHPDSYIERARQLGIPLDEMVANGKLDIMYLRPLDLSVDETLHEIRQRVERLGATRVVIDSLTGFEAALAPNFRPDFRESFYRMLVALTSTGVTVLSTAEISEGSDYLRFSPYDISFLSDDIVTLRYVELDGALEKVVVVVKMRGSEHSTDIRRYQITSSGLRVLDAMRDYHGVITGIPRRESRNS